MDRVLVLVSFIVIFGYSLSSPVNSPEKSNDAWSKRVQDRLSVIESELLAIAKLVDGNGTSILARMPRQADDDEDEFEEGVEYEDSIVLDRINEDDVEDDLDDDDEDYVDEDVVVERIIEVDDVADEDDEDDEEFETSALIAERSLRSKNPRIVDDDEKSVEGSSGSTDVAVKEVGESHSSSVSKIKRKRKSGKKKKSQVGLSSKKRQKTKSKKGKKSKKSKKKKRKQTGLSAGKGELTENQISTLCENQRLKKQGISETTTLRQTDTNQDLAAQVAKLAEAFKLLQEAITKAKGSDLGSVSVPTSVPSSAGSGSGSVLKEVEKPVENPVPAPSNVSSEPPKEPAPADAPSSGIDSLVKAAIGVQGQAANALKGMLPGGR